MASRPEIPQPDTIDPQSPPEIVPNDPGVETPISDPPGFAPPQPDHDTPDPDLPEMPPPPD